MDRVLRQTWGTGVVTTWQRHGEVLWRRSGSRRLLRCPGTDELLVIEGGGSTAWDLLGEPVEEGELFALLSGAFGVDRAQVDAEIGPFLEQLRSVGAVIRT